MKGPQPGDRTKGDFQTAGPIDPDLWWILIHPGLEMLDERLRVLFVTRQPVSLTQDAQNTDDDLTPR